MNVKHYIPFILITGLLIWSLSQTISIKSLSGEVEGIAEEVHRVTEEKEQIVQMWIIKSVTATSSPLSAETPFVPLGIDMDVDLQKHAQDLCIQYEIPFPVVMAVAWHESRFEIDATGYNANGTTDFGIMQINSCNWQWLYDDHDLDVSDPYDNIEAGVLILSLFWEKYSPEQALTAYAWGEAGMLRSEAVAPSAARVLELASQYEQERR